MRFLWVIMLSALLSMGACKEASDEAVGVQELERTAQKVGKQGYADNAEDFNNAIVGLQARIAQEMLKLGQAQDFRTQLQHVAKAADDALRDLNALRTYPGGAAFKRATKAQFEFFRSIARNEYMTVAKIQDKATFTIADKETIERLVKQVGDKETIIDQQFETAQEAFARKNGVVLLENELQKEINRADQQ